MSYLCLKATKKVDFKLWFQDKRLSNIPKNLVYLESNDCIEIKVCSRHLLQSFCGYCDIWGYCKQKVFSRLSGLENQETAKNTVCKAPILAKALDAYLRFRQLKQTEMNLDNLFRYIKKSN